MDGFEQGNAERPSGGVLPDRLRFRHRFGGLRVVGLDGIKPEPVLAVDRCQIEIDLQAINRPVASIEGFGYSDALKRLGGVWTERMLTNYIHYPNSVAPGSRMPASGLHDGEAADVVAFLKTLSDGYELPTE